MWGTFIWNAFLTIVVFQATLAPAMHNCPDLSKLDMTCSADGFSGIRVSKGKSAKPKHVKQGKSSLTAIFASNNRCSLLMERKYIDAQQGKEAKYKVTCFFPDQVRDLDDEGAEDEENQPGKDSTENRVNDLDDEGAEDKEDALDKDNTGDLNPEEEDTSNGHDDIVDGRLVCTNAGFGLPEDTLNVHMEIHGDFDNDHGGELYLFGTASSAKAIGSWTDTCKLKKKKNK
jgi:hypothetical protein